MSCQPILLKLYIAYAVTTQFRQEIIFLVFAYPCVLTALLLHYYRCPIKK